ncbi:uncharacterized protein [Montipora capricornis]|uniref:uncharacterized protein n=1 Tax=Montipora capricornis TaxID=246305 RepID=UPI0035F1F5BE
MEQPGTSRVLRRRKRAATNYTFPMDEPSTSSVPNGDQNLHALSDMPDELSPSQEESECVTRRSKRNRPQVEDKLEESSSEGSGNTAPLINEDLPSEQFSSNKKRRRICDDSEGSSTNITTHTEQIAVESQSQGPSPTRSQEDVMIVGDVQVARPEVIDLERLPTIRQGGSVVVDLTNDGSFRDNNVVDLTRENSADSSFDSSPVIVCVNRIYHRDPIRQLPSCRYELFPSLLDSAFNAITGGADDEVQEVSDANAGSTQNLSLNPSISSTEDPNSEQTQKNKIVCPVCLDDDQTLKKRKRQLTSTTCGHVFCDRCIRSAVQLQNKCPTCRKKLSLRQLHPIFL